MNIKSLPTWLKFGSVLAGIGFIFSILHYFTISPFPGIPEGSFGMSPFDGVVFLISIPLSLIFPAYIFGPPIFYIVAIFNMFIIGSIIGWIYGKLRNM